MEVNNGGSNNTSPAYRAGYLIGRIFAIVVVIGLGLLTLLLFAGLGYKLIAWIFGF